MSFLCLLINDLLIMIYLSEKLIEHVNIKCFLAQVYHATFVVKFM